VNTLGGNTQRKKEGSKAFDGKLRKKAGMSASKSWEAEKVT